MKLAGLATIVSSLALATTAACGTLEGESSGEPGISKDKILIGSTIPASGPVAFANIYGEGANAYFKYLNAEEDGIDGREVEFKWYDDGGEPGRALQNVRKLVEKDEAFAIGLMFGTASTLATRDYLNEREVPQVLVDTGFPEFQTKNGMEKYPWTSGFLPAYTVEAAVNAAVVKKTNPSAKVAILYQNDDLGKSLTRSFEKAIEGSQISIVAKQSYNLADDSAASQMTSLAKSGADVFLNFAQGTFVPQAIKKAADLGWKPTMFLPTFSAGLGVLEPAGLQNVKGAYSAIYLKDPRDPRWTDDAGMKKYKEIINKYGGGVDANDRDVAFGYSEGQALAEVIDRMEEPTRQSLADAVLKLDGVTLDLMLPGISMTTGPGDGFLIETLAVQRFDGQEWRLQDELYSFEGRGDDLASAQ